MSLNNFNEDLHWARVQDEYENPRRLNPMDPAYEPIYETDFLYLDDEEQEDITFRWGYPVEKLTEDDLLEIVKDTLGIEAESAAWDPQSESIDYSYQVA